MAELRWEPIMSVTRELVTDPASGDLRLSGRQLVEFNDTNRDLDISAGNEVTLDTSNPFLNGIWKISKVATSTRGYTLLTLQSTTPTPFPSKGNSETYDPPVTGKIYFGRKAVGAVGVGGKVTQFLGSDVGAVMVGVGILALTIGAVYSFFFKDKDPVNI